MGTCTEHDIDVCAEFGSQTEGHSRCFVGLSDLDDLGDCSNMQNCNVGCGGCHDTPSELEVSHFPRTGTRWLTPNKASPASRDAHGRYHDVASATWKPNADGDLVVVAEPPRRVPLYIEYLRGACYKQTKNLGFEPDVLECFNRNVCKCFPAVNPYAGSPTQCPDETKVDFPLQSQIPDEFASADADWPSGNHSCRMFLDAPDQVFAGGSAGLDLAPPIFMRTWWNDPLLPDACSVDWLVVCTALVPSSPCDCSNYQTRLQTGSPPFHYNESVCRRIFDEALLQNFDAKIRKSPRLAGRSNERIDLMNLILKKIPATDFPHESDGGNDVIRFDRVDYQQQAQNSNSKLGRWERFWPIDGKARTFAELPLVVVLPDCYLKNSRCPVEVTVRFALVHIIVKIVYLQSGPQGSQSTEPHVRILVRAQCAVQARLINPCTFTKSWLPDGDPGKHTTLTIVNPADWINPPQVSPAGADSIVYVYGGKPIDFPWWTEWEGMLGGFSDPTTRTSGVGGGVTEQVCKHVAGVGSQGRNGIQVPGWPWLSESYPDDRNQHYDGSIDVSFHNDNYAQCPG